MKFVYKDKTVPIDTYIGMGSIIKFALAMRGMANAKVVLAMKLTIFLFLLVALQVVGETSHAQQLSIQKKDATLLEVLKTVRKQTGYLFVCDLEMLRKAEKVNINFKNASLIQVLDACFVNQPLTYNIVDKTIIVRKKKEIVPTERQSAELREISSSQVPNLKDRIGMVEEEKIRDVRMLLITVRGKVTDAKGEGLPGVNVIEKGTQTGSVTDATGAYTLDISGSSSVLVFSFVGYVSQEIPVRNKATVDVTLAEDIKALEEVVVVGYGTQKRVNLTGAVSTISGTELQRTPTNNLTNAVGGRMPGVITVNGNGRPGSGSNISIRGVSTLNNNSPLIVVDGIVRSDGFGNIDPNEVQSISILKDASAASVYGARASNGVILVTTKRGKLGKPSVSYTAMVGLQTPTQYPKLMSAYDYASVRNQALRNQGYDQSNPSQSGLFFTDDALESYRPGVTDWYKETFKNNSLQNQHNVTVSGGTEAIRYFTSLGYLGQDGMYDNIKFKRFNLRTNVDAKVNNNLTVGLNLEGRQELSNAPAFDANQFFELAVRSSPLMPPYHASGRPFNTQGEHPVEMIYSSGYDNRQTNIFQGTLFFEHALPFITDGLSVRGNLSYYNQQLFNKTFFTPYSLYDEDLNGAVTNVKVVGGVTSLTEIYSQLKNLTSNISLNYAKTIGRHEIAGLLLYEQYSSKGDSLYARKQDFATNIKDELFASGPANQTINGTGLLNDARRSLVGRVNYALDGKYLLEATFRYDGSYRFPKNKRYGFFPAFSAGWRISEENFFKNAEALKLINSLKFRISKGLIGNDRVGAFQFTDAYSIIAGSGPIVNGQALPFVRYGVFPNPNITWEKQDNTNLGLDALFINSKLGVEFDYFFRTTRDILWSRVRSVPGTFGRTLPNENYAEVKSQGLELMISYQGNAGDFGYNLRLIGSYAQNKVTKIDDPSNALDYQRQLGRPIGFRAGYEALGMFRSQEEADSWSNGYQFGQKSMAGDIKYADLDGDGVVSIPDQKIISNYGNTPRIMYGFTAGFTWKNFDLNFLFQGAAQRNMILSGSGRIMYRNGGSNNNFAYLKDSWSPENPDAEYPIAWVDARSVNERDSDFWLRKAGYIRLKSADLGYNFQSEWLKSKKIQRLRIYISGLNLLTFSGIKEFDPEAETGSGSYYPQQRNINAGLNLSF